MSLQIRNVTVDCADPRTLSAWWREALSGSVLLDVGTFVFIAGGGLALGFQQVSEPRRGKNSVHVDLATDDRPAEVARLVGLGATKVGEHTVPGAAWTVLRDPEGNEFCVSDARPGETIAS